MSVNRETWTAFGSDVGRKRHNNEDYVLACEPSNETLRSTHGCLYIVADGIGGGAAGEVASSFAAQAVAHHYYEQSGDPASILISSILETNSTLYDYAHRHPRLATMGTTLVAAVIHGNTLHVSHVGDSRAYLIRQGDVQRLTQDHNVAAQLARDGIITEAQAERHPQRNLLLRSLGAERHIIPDQSQTQLYPGDTLLLCTDGLTRHVRDSELARFAVLKTPAQTIASLLDRANRRGGHDNISVLLVRWSCEAQSAASHQAILQEPPSLPNIADILNRASAPSLAGLVAGS